MLITFVDRKSLSLLKPLLFHRFFGLILSFSNCAVDAFFKITAVDGELLRPAFVKTGFGSSLVYPMSLVNAIITIGKTPAAITTVDNP